LPDPLLHPSSFILLCSKSCLILPIKQAVKQTNKPVMKLFVLSDPSLPKFRMFSDVFIHPATSFAPPVVTEVIPFSGPPSGFTRVAILGANFVDSPTTRVSFDGMEVMPIFHGPKTLVCHTPKHPPGLVKVRVCNNMKRWSETSATFTYDEAIPEEEGKQAASIDMQFDLNIGWLVVCIQFCLVVCFVV